METFKKILTKFFFPHLVLVAMIVPVATGLLVYAFAIGLQNDVIAYVSYGLSAYALTIVCLRIPRWVKGISRVPKENKYVKSYVSDVNLRIKVSLYVTLSINISYAILQLGLGVYYDSIWFYTLFGYYALLALMRFFLSQDAKNTMLGENRLAELKRYRFCGSVLLVINLVLAVIVVYIVWQNRGFEYNEILTITMAAYTFFSMTKAIVHVIKYRRYNSPVMSAAKVIGFTAALVSMLSLETAMLTAWGREDSVMFRRIMTGATGAMVCIIVHALAIYMIVHATKEIKLINKGVITNE